MSFEPLVILILFLQLRKTARKTNSFPELEKNFKKILIGGIALFVLQVVLDTPYQEIIGYMWYIALAAVFLFIFKHEEFRLHRGTVWAVVPLTIVSFLTNTLELFHIEVLDKVSNVIEVALPFAIIWLIALLIINNKQRKALQKEHDKTMVEEQQKKYAEEKKAELEILVNERTAEITQQKEELQKTIHELRDAQDQLIQSEKMASLGELTAGIAHEIQNPLNFVNNFSEVNAELIEEMIREIENKNDQEVKVIAQDIRLNLEKIAHHGKRADAIVKSMLQHSRASTGQKEATDINTLVDECLRLSYHGFRARDKSFNVTFTADLDPEAGSINAVPEELGRVLLNLFTNAFYSVLQKQKTSKENFSPAVTVSTKRKYSRVEIRIRDNGIGIPEKVLDKIFQPFFTTKPSGEGTGLGLSLSYDIITKGHAGELRVETKEGEYAEFVISLPVNGR
jgi:two-component system NtrC family sensor kinase